MFSTRSLQAITHLRDAEQLTLVANVRQEITGISVACPDTKVLEIVKQLADQADIYIGMVTVLADGSEGGSLLIDRGDSQVLSLDKSRYTSIYIISSENTTVSVNRWV